MCNPRHIQSDSSDDESYESTKQPLFDVSKLTLKNTRTKSGRKGDPRMHRALQARLNNPKSGLLDALTKGGFEFHMVDNVWYDKDNILLSQRKNQLSRRVRLFKQNQQKYADAARAEQAQASTPPVKCHAKDSKDKTKTRDKNQLKRFSDLNKEKSGKKQKISDSDATELESDSTLSASLSSKAGSNAVPAPVFSSEVNSVYKSAVLQESSIPKCDQDKVHSAAPTRKSCNNSGERAPSTTEVIANCYNSNEKFDKAVNMYLYQSSQLMKTCLESAGFSKDECKENARTYSEFARRLMQCELTRFKKMRCQTTSMDFDDDCRNNKVESQSLQATLQDSATLKSVTDSGQTSPDIFVPDTFISGGRNESNDLSSTSAVQPSMTPSSFFNQDVNVPRPMQHRNHQPQQSLLQVPSPCYSSPPSTIFANNYEFNTALDNNNDNNNPHSQYVQWDNAPQASISTNNTQPLPTPFPHDERITSNLPYCAHGNNQIKALDAMKLMRDLELDHIADGQKIYEISDSNIIDDDELVDILRRSSDEKCSDDSL